MLLKKLTKNKMEKKTLCVLSGFWLQLHSKLDTWSIIHAVISEWLIFSVYFLQQERINIEEKYASLQEEAAGKTKKLKKVWSMLMSAKSEVCIFGEKATDV